MSLPPALETTPRPNGVDDADADAAVGNEKGGTSSANGNVGGTIAPQASSTTATEDPTQEVWLQPYSCTSYLPFRSGI